VADQLWLMTRIREEEDCMCDWCVQLQYDIIILCQTVMRFGHVREHQHPSRYH